VVGSYRSFFTLGYEMLIENGKLNIDEFKAFFPNINWKRVPRKLGPNHSEFFHMGNYEDPEKIIAITIRPSKIMAVSETFRNRLPTDGSVPKEGYRGQLVDWGSTVEVRVDESFLKAVADAAKPMPVREHQTVSWE
jgi:hypothetical protein